MNRVVSIYVRYKGQRGKRCFVPATYSGKASLKPQRGATQYIRWYEGSKPIAKKVGARRDGCAKGSDEARGPPRRGERARRAILSAHKKRHNEPIERVWVSKLD